MSKTAQHVLVGLLVALAIATGCAAPPESSKPASTPAEPLTLVVVHSNDTWGYLGPCG